MTKKCQRCFRCSKCPKGAFDSLCYNSTLYSQITITGDVYTIKSHYWLLNRHGCPKCFRCPKCPRCLPLPTTLLFDSRSPIDRFVTPRARATTTYTKNNGSAAK